MAATTLHTNIDDLILWCERESKDALGKCHERQKMARSVRFWELGKFREHTILAMGNFERYYALNEVSIHLRKIKEMSK